VHLFVDAIQKSKIDPVKIMRLYSKVARIRLISTDQVLNAAEEVGKRLFQAYELPPDNPSEVLARYATAKTVLIPCEIYRSLPARAGQSPSTGVRIPFATHCLESPRSKNRLLMAIDDSGSCRRQLLYGGSSAEPSARSSWNPEWTERLFIKNAI
jgi:hypothetical protein